MKDYLQIQQYLKSYLESYAHLKRLGVVNTKKDFTSQLGEFLVAELYDGMLAKNNIQPDWDIELPTGKKVQVKSHATATTNKNTWTGVNYQEDAEIDVFIIVVFTEDYKLKDFYKIPWQKLYPLSKQDNTRRLIRWHQLANYRIANQDLPKQELIKLFS